jgi:hypothetical protein
MQIASNIFSSGRVFSLGIRNATYCPGDAVGGSDFAKLLARVKAAYPADYPKMNHAQVPWLYDAMLISKAAIEATKSVDAATLAKWIEGNAKSIKAVTGPLAISDSYHLLYGSEIFTFIARPDQEREDGLVPRAAC